MSFTPTLTEELLSLTIPVPKNLCSYVLVAFSMHNKLIVQLEAALPTSLQLTLPPMSLRADLTTSLHLPEVLYTRKLRGALCLVTVVACVQGRCPCIIYGDCPLMHCALD